MKLGRRHIITSAVAASSLLGLYLADIKWDLPGVRSPKHDNEKSHAGSDALHQTNEDVLSKGSGQPDDVRTLVANLKRETNFERRSELRQAIATSRDPASIDFMVTLLMQSPDSDVAQGAEQALLGMMSAPLMQKIIGAYRGAAKPSAKKLALLVERVQTPEALPVLEEMLKASAINSEDPLTLSALHTLAVTGTPYAAAALARRLDQAATPEEEAILTNALAAVSRDGTENELIAIAQGKQDVTKAVARAGAIRALANYPISQVRGALQELAADSEPLVASTAVQVLNSFTAP